MRFSVDGEKIKKFLLAAIIFFSLVGITLFVLAFLKSAKLNILVTPSNAVVKIDGKEYGNGNYKLMPKGLVTAEISADGFETKTIQLNIERNQTASISTYLLSKDEDHFSVYMKDKENFEILKLVANDKYKDQIAELFKKVQVRDILPLKRVVAGFNGSETYIKDASNEENCSVVVCLRIKTSTGSIEIAKELLAKAGYNINDYEVFREDI